MMMTRERQWFAHARTHSRIPVVLYWMQSLYWPDAVLSACVACVCLCVCVWALSLLHSLSLLPSFTLFCVWLVAVDSNLFY